MPSLQEPKVESQSAGKRIPVALIP